MSLSPLLSSFLVILTFSILMPSHLSSFIFTLLRHSIHCHTLDYYHILLNLNCHYILLFRGDKMWKKYLHYLSFQSIHFIPPLLQFCDPHEKLKQLTLISFQFSHLPWIIISFLKSPWFIFIIIPPHTPSTTLPSGPLSYFLRKLQFWLNPTISG